MPPKSHHNPSRASLEIQSDTQDVLANVPEFARSAVLNLIHSSPDPERVRAFFAAFELRFRGRISTLATGAGSQLTWLATVAGHSRFLSEDLLQFPERLDRLSDLDRVLSSEEYRRNLGESIGSSGPVSPLDLARFRREELLRVVIRDALQLATIPEITEELSNLADAILAEALSSVIVELRQRFGVPIYESSASTDDAGFSVIALGKLGGRELNYSSDIDLMFVYAGNGETAGPEVITNREWAKRVSNRLTELLSTYTSQGLCYRVDLRLRPEGSLGEVCISLDAAREYYATRARDWELQMLIKARVAAGDALLGQFLLDCVESDIYSTTLDFTAIETMSATRERISEKLAAKRLKQGEYDVKLTRGGIRDIEFLVQCLQRLHGGREPWVRHGGTLLALSRLLDKDLLSHSEYARLVNAYEFLRYVEHRLQCEDDRQTHTLPAKLPELALVARRLSGLGNPPRPISSAQELRKTLIEHFENVQTIYDRIVHAQRPLPYSSSLAQTEESISEQSSTIPREEPPSSQIRHQLLVAVSRSSPSLANFLASHGLTRSRQSVEHFLERLLEFPGLLSLFELHPLLSTFTVRIFESSPYLADQLIRQPQLLEEIVRVIDHPERHWSFEGLAAPLNDLSALRRFFRREALRIQAASVCRAEPVFQTLDRMSALAEFMIARAYRIALEQAIQHARGREGSSGSFPAPREEMMIVALGRLGMREFDLASDADLLFIIPDTEAVRHKFWTRVAEHVIEILTTYTADGTILSIDSRLRPNGREGSLVQTESSYTEYFEGKAEVWEGIAYMKARAVAGDCERALSFLGELQKVDWRRYGQSGRSKQDLRQMRLKLEREQSATSPLKAGRGGVYDADFILMYLRLRGAGLFYKSLNTPERIDILEKMGHLDRADADFLLEASTFYRALDHAVRLVTGHSEGRLPAIRSELEMVAELLSRWIGVQREPADVEHDLASLQDRSRRVFERIFG
jgi:[glutamine synthetase] adenylyltransferase / [glutamine synthetase]-adenylyl-L-tyrosine phosphorylase